MKYAADFRSIARTALKGKWSIAVVAGLIASLLGAIGSSGPELNVELNDGNFNASLQILGQDVVSSNAGFEFWPVIAGIATYVAIFAIVFGIALLWLSLLVSIAQNIVSAGDSNQKSVENGTVILSAIETIAKFAEIHLQMFCAGAVVSAVNKCLCVPN